VRNAVIETRGLSRSFGSLRAVQGVDLTVEEGEMFGLVGPDGAGKTTLIRMLCGILAPSAGEAKVLGHDVVKEADRIKKDIGYLSQRFSLYGDLTVDENIEFFAEINGVFKYRDRREELLEFTRLTPFRDRLADRLSGGMKQKLALACTLVHTPKIILLDEPTTGVDPVSRRDFWQILQNLLHEGITIFMSTPYLDEAERCSRVAMMNAAAIMRVDSPRQLKASMHRDVVEIICHPVREAYRILKSVSEEMEVQAFGDRLHIIVGRAGPGPEALVGDLTRQGIHVSGARKIGPSLENVFISLLTQQKERS
jgi:ABC-2 type transport system ATP-binding protein